MKVKLRIEKDILLINVLSIVLIFITLFLSIGSTMFFKIVRVILAFVFVAFFPGYLILKVCFATEELNIFERIALSFGTSMLIVPIFGLLLIYIFSGIYRYDSIFLIYFFIVVFSIFGQLLPKYYVSDSTSVFNLRSVNYILVFILVTLFGIVIRFYPAVKYSSFGGVWIPGNHLYPVYYTIHTGELLKRDSLNTPTIYSITIYNDLQNKANLLFQPFYFLVSGFTNLNEFLYINKYFEIYGALLFPLSALIVANKVWRIQKGSELPSYYNIFVFIVANFATHKILVDSRFMLNNLIIGYAMILFTIYFLLSEKNIKNKIFGMLFGVYIFLYYYTAGLVFLVILVAILLIQIIKNERLISIWYIVFYCVSFVAYYGYLAEATFTSYVVTLREAIFTPGAMPGQPTFGRPLVELTIPCFCAYLNLFLLGFLILLFIFLWINNKIERNTINNFAMYLCVGLILVGGMFFSWIGIKGLARLGAYALIPFIVILSSLLIARQSLIRRITIIISILMVLTTIVAYTPGTLVHPNYLTYSEKCAIVWYCNHKSLNINKDFVFTDGRIGTAPVMLNCFTFTGISGYTKRCPIEEKVLQDVFYGYNATKAAADIVRHYRSSYILLSDEMINFGVFSLNNNYKPISIKSFIKFEDSQYFCKIYTTGHSYYFMVVKSCKNC